MTCWLVESSVTLNILLPNQRRDIHITLGSPMLQGALFLINPGIIEPLQMIILRGYNVGRVILAGLKVGKYLL